MTGNMLEKRNKKNIANNYEEVQEGRKEYQTNPESLSTLLVIYFNAMT